METHGLAGPQALILKALQAGSLSAGELAARVNLSQATVTDILNRLEQRGLVINSIVVGDIHQAMWNIPRQVGRVRGAYLLIWLQPGVLIYWHGVCTFLVTRANGGLWQGISLRVECRMIM
jgi:hypothetical protein